MKPPDSNPLKIYLKFCGMRSFIFQVLLLAWTCFSFLLWIGMAISVAGKDNDVAANAIALGSCCGCGGYMLIAIPLGCFAIATLETSFGSMASFGGTKHE